MESSQSIRSDLVKNFFIPFIKSDIIILSIVVKLIIDKYDCNYKINICN